jgi:hypothetical protein
MVSETGVEDRQRICGRDGGADSLKNRQRVCTPVRRRIHSFGRSMEPSVRRPQKLVADSGRKRIQSVLDSRDNRWGFGKP